MSQPMLPNDQVRKAALPWNGQAAIDVYLQTHKDFAYGDKFLQLLAESYHSYVAGCARASIILSGEALLRLLYDRMIWSLKYKGPLTFAKGKQKKVIISEKTQTLFKLEEDYTYNEVIEILEQNKIFAVDLTSQMRVIKDLRNRAAHSDFPVLNDWDPDEPRGTEKIKEIWSDPSFQFPEAYQFIANRKGRKSIKIDLRKHNCGSFRELSYELRFAAIQYLLLIDLMKKI